MSVTLTSGDLFESEADVLVNPVNCVGVPGAGLARAFAQRFPAQTKKYQEACVTGVLGIGRVLPTFNSGDPVILHFPTKDHWRNPSKLEWITSGLVSMHRHLGYLNKRTVACPALGCGLGGLDFVEVYGAIYREFKDTGYDIRVYRPG